MLNSFNQAKVVLMLTAETLWNTVVILATLFFSPLEKVALLTCFNFCQFISILSQELEGEEEGEEEEDAESDAKVRMLVCLCHTHYNPEQCN